MRHASLFSGIGGFDLAASWMGWENIFSCEYMRFPQRVLSYHFPSSDHHGNIRRLDGTKYRGRIDVLSGGFPCQPISVAGRRRGKSDDRFLWPEMRRVIREVRPTWVVAENVAGLVSMAQFRDEPPVDGEGRPIGVLGDLFHRTGSGLLREILEEIEAEGYEVVPIVIPACSVGAPHLRYRVWLVATDTGGERRQQNSGGSPRHERTDGRRTEDDHVPAGESEESDTDAEGERVRSGLRESREGRKRSRRSHDVPLASPDSGRERRTARTEERVQREGQEPKREDSRYARRSDAPDADDRRRERPDVAMERKQNRKSPVASRRDQDAHNSLDSGLEGHARHGNATAGRQEQTRPAPTSGWREPWSSAASRLCRVDDGLSGKLDGVTVSDWRKKSLEAYGNAIVPQIAYEIFRAIEAS